MSEETLKTTNKGDHNLFHNLKTGILGACLALAVLTAMGANADAQVRNPVRPKPTTGQTINPANKTDTTKSNTTADQSGASGTSGFFTNTSDAVNIPPDEDFRNAKNVVTKTGADSTVVNITYDLNGKHRSVVAIADPLNPQPNTESGKMKIGVYYVKTKNDNNELFYVPIRSFINEYSDSENLELRRGEGPSSPPDLFTIYYNNRLKILKENLLRLQGQQHQR